MAASSGKGVAWPIAWREHRRGALGKLFRREMSLKPPTNVPCWIAVQTDNGPSLRALAFVSNRNGQSYAGKRTLEETADILSEACGHLGSCAEYLHNTVSHLEARGIHDRNLWRLQHLVAERHLQLCRVRRPRIEPRQKECERW